jgi:anthranilate phosphoribosyltransferase
MIKATTNKLINNEEIVESELKEVFEEIYSGLANEIQATSFLTALSASNINEK